MLESISSYGKYADSNMGQNTLVVTLGTGLKIYKSYNTTVAFYSIHYGLVVCRNIWGNTTWVPFTTAVKTYYHPIIRRIRSMSVGHGMSYVTHVPASPPIRENFVKSLGRPNMIF